LNRFSGNQENGQFDRKGIKSEWQLKFKAETNYISFIDQIKREVTT